MKKLTKRERKFIENIPKKKEYKLSVFRTLLFFSPIIFLVICFALLNDGREEIILWISTVILITLPSIILIINHLYYSPYYKIYIDTNENLIKLTSSKEKREIQISNIYALEMVSVKRVRNPLFIYEYAALHLTNKKIIYINSLLLDPLKFSSYILEKKFIYREVFFPFISS